MPKIENPKSLVESFARAVTCEGREAKDWIARKGRYSLQGVLERMVPEVIWVDNDRRCRTRTKLATAAFLKVLQSKCGFQRIRIRRRGLDCDAGNLLYCGRRWLNPAQQDERAELERNHEALCTAFPFFSNCPLDKFMAVLGEVSTSWLVILNKIRSRNPYHRIADRNLKADNGVSPNASAMDLSNLLNPDSSESDMEQLSTDDERQHTPDDHMSPAEHPYKSALLGEAIKNKCDSEILEQGFGQKIIDPQLRADDCRASLGAESSRSSDRATPGHPIPGMSIVLSALRLPTSSSLPWLSMPCNFDVNVSLQRSGFTV